MAEERKVVTLDAMDGEDDPESDFVLVDGAMLPRSVDFAWPRTGDGIPDLSMRFEVIDGRPQCRSVVIESVPGGREVRSADLRFVRIEDALELVFARHGLGADPLGSPDPVGESRKAVRSARKPRITNETLREVADLYRASAETTTAPIRAVEQSLGVSYRTAQLYVQRARKAGFLGPALRGRAGEAPS